jgi:hypothetical protein
MLPSEWFRTRTIHTSKHNRDFQFRTVRFIQKNKIISLVLMPGLSQLAEHPCVVCLLGMVKCLCFTIAGLVLLPVGYLYVVVWMPCAMYYAESKLFSSYPLMVKYACQGIQLPGRVLDKHVHDEKDEYGAKTYSKYFVKVEYQFHESCYMKEFVVSYKIWETAHTGSNLDIVIFPNYPRSATLLSAVQEVDPDIPPSSSLACILLFLLILMYVGLTPVCLPLLLSLPCNVGNVDCLWLAVALFSGTQVLCLTGAYWEKRWGQNGVLNDLLHSAHRVRPRTGDVSADVAAAKKRESYYDFCPEAKHSLLYAVAVVILDIGGALLLLIYGCFLSGGHCAWRTLLQWKKRLVGRYDITKRSDVICRVVGSVVCEELFGTVIVQYQVDNKTYKKRMHATKDTNRGTSLELLYLKGLPKSAWVTEQQSNPAECCRCEAIWALILMPAQIAIFWASFRRSVPYPKEAFAGIVTLGYLALTFVIYSFRTCEEKGLLPGAKEIVAHEATVPVPGCLEEASEDTSGDTSSDMP